MIGAATGTGAPACPITCHLGRRVVFLKHRILHVGLPLWLDVRQALVGGYERLLAQYQRDFLRRQREFPSGVPYRLLSADPVAAHSTAYRLLAPPGLRHRCGEVLLMRWRNSDAEVQALLRARGWKADQRVRLRSASSVFRPGAWLSSDLASALREHVEIRLPASAMGRAHGHHEAGGAAPASEPPLGLAAALERDDPSRRLSAESVLAAQPRIAPRSYSICGIERSAAGEVVELLVSEVTEQVRAADGTTACLPGRCTGYLTRLPRREATVHGWPLAFPLRLDPDGQPDGEGSRPLLIVATGIAAAGPLCELESAETEAPAGNGNGRPLWLVCGLRSFDPAQPYVRRLLAFAARRPAARVDLALSRDAAPARTAELPDNCVLHAMSRVQDVLERERARLRDHFQAGGDTVVIGHQSMGTAVQAWLKRFLAAEYRLPGLDAAAERLRALENSLRVQYSLSGR